VCCKLGGIVLPPVLASYGALPGLAYCHGACNILDLSRLSGIGNYPDVFSFLSFQSSLLMICFRKGSLFCCAASRDVSVGVSRARLMADAVSVGTSTAVDECVTSPPAKRTSSISAAAAEGAVRPVSFLLGSTVQRSRLVGNRFCY
jgi:hypothetical protein